MAMPSGSQQILYNYGAVGSSYALEYNLFADKWLGTDLVDEAVSVMISKADFRASSVLKIVTDLQSGDDILAKSTERES